LNQSKLQNLGILDQQYERQAGAKSNTKAITQAALNSISAKYLQNELENKTLQTYENMYNYRYGKDMRAQNWNELFQPNIPTVGTTETGRETIIGPNGETLYPQYKNEKLTGYLPEDKATTANQYSSGKKSGNGSIVKSSKNL